MTKRNEPPYAFRNGFLPVIVLFSALFLSTACSPAITLKIKPDTTDSATFATELSPTAENLVRRLTEKGSGSKQDEKADFYDREKITVSLAHAGLRADALEFTGQTGIRLALSLVKTDEFLGNAVVLQKDAKKISVTLSRETLAKAVELMPNDTRDYLDLFMAPAFTGETITVPEYEEIIAATYGKTLANELRNSAFVLSVQCPNPVISAKISQVGAASRSGNTVTFRIPLANLLVLEAPIVAEAAW